MLKLKTLKACLWLGLKEIHWFMFCVSYKVTRK